MGTNYYHRTDICESCNRYKEKHIGKNSHGWQFAFQAHINGSAMPKISSFKDWKREIQADGKIFDEYGREFTLEEFVKLVESKKTAPNNQYDYMMKEAKNRGYDMDRDWKDEEGFAFTACEFS